MANKVSIKKLASQLAKTAHMLRQDLGDTEAQLAVYGLLLDRLGVLKSEVGDICPMPDASQLNKIFAQYNSSGKDPAVYFYEDFLRAYDPHNARGRGVHYSPPAVVDYMVRCVSSILRSRFGRELGDAVVIDPCCGVGTFLRYIEQISNLKPRMIGMELMPVPCEIARLLTRSCEIMQINSLEDFDVQTGSKPLVILGNPPYSGHSSNNGTITDLIKDYKTGLDERNPKWLQDDYVKFIRMAQKRVDDAGGGVVAFITNHSFVFNPTFRVMRSSLMKSFDDIFILDLHGNAKSTERNDDKEDENIFNIQMGVSISFMIKTSDSPECKIRYADIHGSRKSKFKALAEMDFSNTPWKEVEASEPFFLFSRHDSALQKEYYGFPSVFDLFIESSVGFVTSRDSFAISFDRSELLHRIAMLRDGKIGAYELGVGDLDIEKAKAALRSDPKWEEKAVPVLYRPFDKRWAYYSRAVMERPRLPFMNHMLKENVALAVGRAGQVTGSACWDVVFCTDSPADLNLFRRGGAMLFPLYLYAENERRFNILSEDHNHLDLFYYIYAILHSHIYRSRYADFLKIDYPRIPITQNEDVFKMLAGIGNTLVETHLGHISETSDSNETLTIGGYKLPEKYNSDRKCRLLTEAELHHAAKMRAAISKTIALQEQIDKVIESNPPWGNY